MTCTSSLCNFLSFLSPSKPPPPKTPPPPNLLHLHIPSHTHNKRVSLPLVANAVNPLSSPPSLPSSSDYSSIVCPSLAYANTLFFKSAYNVQVIVDDNEPEEKLLGRFRREVMRAGVIQECKRRRFFENKQDERKRKTREAAKRNKRRRTQWRPMQNKDEAPVKKKDDDEEDNWELPGGDLPN